MLELARLSDRNAVNTLAAEVHAMHVTWRPDIYEMTEELIPKNGLRQRSKPENFMLPGSVMP